MAGWDDSWTALDSAMVLITVSFAVQNPQR
jgi:hypothetical protein